jgi:dienelactone hydrolase
MCQPERGHLEGPACDIPEHKLRLGPDNMFATLYLPDDGTVPRGGIVVVHDVFGHRNFYQNIGRRLAFEGYVTVVPDLFHRQGTIDPPCDEALGQARRAKLDERLTLEVDLAAAVDTLRTGFDVGHVTSIGFCLGGTFAMLQGTNGQADAVVSYYGFPIPNRPELTPYCVLDDVDSFTAPLLGFWGSADSRVDLGSVQLLDQQLTTRGRKPEIHVWPDLPHGFLTFDPGAPLLAASSAAWDRTLKFVEEQAALTTGALVEAILPSDRRTHG